MCSVHGSPSIDSLADQICELNAHIAAATCRWLLLVAEFDAREGWGIQGSKSCADWLTWACSIAPRAAREHVRVARALGGLPRVREAFAKGELSYCKVRAITRVATDALEEELVEIARHATGAQLERLVRGYRRAVSATLDAARAAGERRFLSWQWEDDGSLRLQGRLTPEDGALLMQALQTIDVHDLADAGMERADALVGVARAALTAGESVRAGCDRTEVVVHIDVESLAGDTVHDRSELADGPAIPPETARRLACDAAVVRILEHGGEPLAVGRRTRTIPPAIRRALRARDRGCRFPGCGHTRFLHAHHIRHWARGGPTELGNLVQLCSYHHRLVHEEGFKVECERSGPLSRFRFRRPDGAEIPAHPHRSASGAGLEGQHRIRGVVVNPRTCVAQSAGDRFDYGIAVEQMLRPRRGP